MPLPHSLLRLASTAISYDQTAPALASIALFRPPLVMSRHRGAGERPRRPGASTSSPPMRVFNFPRDARAVGWSGHAAVGGCCRA